MLFSSLSSTQLAAALAVIQAASGTTTGEGYYEFDISPLQERVEPGISFTYSGTTYGNPMITEKTAMQEMLASFTSTELASAKISGTFSDCLLIPGSTSNTFPATKQGIKVSALSAAAQVKVLAGISCPVVAGTGIRERSV